MGLVEVVAATALQQSRRVNIAGLSKANKATFINLTRLSVDTLLDQETVCHRVMRDVVHDWERSYNGCRAIADSEEMRFAVRLPSPHCLLLSSNVWKSYALPLVRGRIAGGMGASHPLARRLMQPLLSVAAGAEVDVNQDDADVFALNPVYIQSLADSIRELAASSALEGLQRSEIKYHLEILQRSRDLMVVATHSSRTKTFDIDSLINCLMLSGFLRSSASMRLAIKYAIKSISLEPSTQARCLDLLSEKHSVPSRTTIYRHRLTLHAGYCLLQQELLKDMMDDPAGITRLGTVDSSPDGEYDWVMCGFTTIRNADLAQCLEHAHRLVRLAELAGDEEIADDVEAETADIMEYLAPRLAIVQAPPAGVGSGKCSLPAKMGAVLHSTRLTSPHWRGCVRLTNSTFSWTGDLGTESHIDTYKCDAR